MNIYNKYYQTQDLFGEPYKELIEFFRTLESRAAVLDIGCGQGRNALALAKLGYEVTGIDSSDLGIHQMVEAAKKYNLKVQGEVADIYTFNSYADYEILLFDSMFHFLKQDYKKEEQLIQKIYSSVKTSTLLIFCIQNLGNKVKILHQIFKAYADVEQKLVQDISYTYIDQKTGHQSVTPYQIIVYQKM